MKKSFLGLKVLKEKMVHVDTVPNGKRFGCICSNCHEKLVHHSLSQC